MGFLCFLKKNKNLFFFKKKQKNGFEKLGGCFSLKKGIFSTLIVFQSFFYFPLIALSGTSHVTISFIVGLAESVGPW